MILAGDIGGTKTLLALASKTAGGEPVIVREASFPSNSRATFDGILDQFLGPDAAGVKEACLGVAGPVIGQRCNTTNLPWLLDAEDLKSRLGTPRVRLLNDLEAMALGMLRLPENELFELNPHAKPGIGHRAVIAAGTGLGEALLYHDGNTYRPIATEGGHTDLAARNEQQDAVLRHLRKRYPGHVSSERIICGDGFGTLYDFLVETGLNPPCPSVPARDAALGIDRNAIISKCGVEGQNETCREAVRMFVEFYGAEAGNLALKGFATGGVYIGGGIAPKILPALQEEGRFMQAFTAKGRFRSFLSGISVRVALNDRSPLLGAMHYWSGAS